MPSTSPLKIGWLAALSPRYLASPSVLVLIAANLLPLYGVLRWGWDLYSLMVLYWMETAIIGLLAIVQMAIAARWLALFLVPFFVIHFGGFMFGHIVFLTVMFGPGGAGSIPFGIPELLLGVLSKHGLWLAVIVLAISHGISFALNVLWPLWRRWRGRGPREPAPADTGNPQDVMGATYGRVVVLHLTIIAGAMLTELFRTRVAAFVLLIVLKTAVDVAAHVRKNLDPTAAGR